jgi:hypothetical protein
MCAWKLLDHLSVPKSQQSLHTSPVSLISFDKTVYAWNGRAWGGCTWDSLCPYVRRMLVRVVRDEACFSGLDKGAEDRLLPLVRVDV